MVILPTAHVGISPTRVEMDWADARAAPVAMIAAVNFMVDVLLLQVYEMC